MHGERVEFLLGPGGLRAAAFLCLKLVARIEVFRFVCASSMSTRPLDLPPDWRYVGVYTDAALANMPTDTSAGVTERCGTNPKHLLRRGGSLHLLMTGDALVAQLSIDRGPICRINTPPVSLTMAGADAFLSYLYTWAPYRRQGAARALIATTVGDLAQRNVGRVLAHVRATNVPSLAAFEHSGWKTCATILCTLDGGLLRAFGAKRAGLVVRSARPAHSIQAE